MSTKVNIQWEAHTELSAAHAAYVVATGAPCTDQKTEQALIEPVTEINTRLLSSSADVGLFWQQYLTELLAHRDFSKACTSALMWSGCNEMQVEPTAKAITTRLSDARMAFLGRFPKLSEQLQLRARPLRDKWDTFGPGLLREVAREIWDDDPPADWWHPRITAYMVQPMRGGDGGYDAVSGSLWIEAMLTDVDVAVPEVLRIAWLISRIAIDSHVRDQSANLTLSTPWSLVSVPLVLKAAANLEVISGEPLPIQRAMELWQFGDAQTAAVLSDWWDDHQKNPTPLPLALKVLDGTLRSQDSGVRSQEDSRLET